MVHDPFVAVGTSTDLLAHATDLRRRWDDRFADGHDARVRDVIADSWTRMAGAGLDPEQLRPTSAVDDDLLESARRHSPLRWCLDDLRGALASMAQDAEHIMVVADPVGTLLWIEGHGRVLDQARSIDFVPGMNWTERSAGTNAIGTALAIDHAVQVFSAEHFLPEQHPWWCSAAPIHHPLTGELLGIVDLSGPQRTAHPHSLALVDAAARIAEQTLRQRVERRPAGGDPAVASRPNRHGRGHVLTGGPTARIDLLATHHATMTRPGHAPMALTLRQGEVVALLAIHRDGLTAEQLTLHLYGDRGNPVTTRALVSRLRDVVGDVVTTRPYRLDDAVRVDLQTVRQLLARGDGAAALAMYRGPLLPQSEVPDVERVRTEIDLAVRAIALRAGPDAIWRWLDTASGTDDLEAIERFLAVAVPDDVRVPAARVRRDAVRGRWQA